MVLESKATVTPDRAISGSYDWLRFDQGATDRQRLVQSPGAVAFTDRSLTIGRTRSRVITNDLRRSKQKRRMGAMEDGGESKTSKCGNYDGQRERIG